MTRAHRRDFARILDATVTALLPGILDRAWQTPRLLAPEWNQLRDVIAAYQAAGLVA